MLRELFRYANKDGSFLISHVEDTSQFTMPHNHFHNYPEIYYLLSGERYYFIKDRTYYVTKGSLVLINSYQIHKTLAAGASMYQRVLIHFNNDFISMKGSPLCSKLVDKLFVPENHVIRLGPAEQAYIETLLSKMQSEVRDASNWLEVSLHSLLLQFLVYIEKNVGNNTANFSHLSPMHEKVSEIVHYINENYMEDLSLEYLSKYFYISHSHLSRIFKGATGFTFVEYLNSIRIKEALRLLKGTDYKVTKVAEISGFKSISHFGRVFKEVTGKSPLQYRKTLIP
jgi:AraC-like DNA-binding protein